MCPQQVRPEVRLGRSCHGPPQEDTEDLTDTLEEEQVIVMVCGLKRN